MSAACAHPNRAPLEAQVAGLHRFAGRLPLVVITHDGQIAEILRPSSHLPGDLLALPSLNRTGRGSRCLAFCGDSVSNPIGNPWPSEPVAASTPGIQLGPDALPSNRLRRQALVVRRYQRSRDMRGIRRAPCRGPLSV